MQPPGLKQQFSDRGLVSHVSFRTFETLSEHLMTFQLVRKSIRPKTRNRMASQNILVGTIDYRHRKGVYMSTCNCGQNILDHHGADPTGKTDSTDAFLRAIAALGSRGGILTIPAGRYRIDGGPISVHTPVCFRGASGMMRTADWSRVDLQGSITTLEFPSDRDGFVVEPDAVSVGFANLALVRDVPDQNVRDFARRGIFAKRPIYVDDVYLVNWERGIELNGHNDHPAQNVNQSRVERTVAENCFWGTYTHGDNSNNCHFAHVLCLSCEAGIYDNSGAGNGYLNCYVDNVAGGSEPPYYMYNQSVLFSCRSESTFPPQFGKSVQVIGGTFNVSMQPALMARLGVVNDEPFRQINGVPARITSRPFENSDFNGAEEIEVTVDGETRVIQFTIGDQSPAQVADRIKAGFPADLPRVAYANVFDNTLHIEGWRGHHTGSVNITGDPAVLAKIGFPDIGKSATAKGVGHLLSQPEILNAIFLGYSGPAGEFGTSEQVQVEVAPRGDIALRWQAIGTDGDDWELSVIRLRDAATGIHRWVFARASAEMHTSLGFTMEKDSLGDNQVVMYRGAWLQRSPGEAAVLLCNGSPSSKQGRKDDIAWNMAANPPVRYVRGAGGWNLP